MLVELAEKKIKAAERHRIIPLMSTDGFRGFFHPQGSFTAAQKREPFRTRLSDDTEIPFGEEGLRT
ncbi:hypothetical protein H2248_003730 [Termitomyces sp. 'cryptogamus']|nr:hypothetical protein H2248_003730 [Termitomyces sp. 'cryptogamus']